MLVSLKSVFKAEREIEVRIVNVYGEFRVYPACEVSKMFADIAGTKTLTDRSIRKIKELGYKIRVLKDATPDFL